MVASSDLHTQMESSALSLVMGHSWPTLVSCYSFFLIARQTLQNTPRMQGLTIEILICIPYNGTLCGTYLELAV